MLRHLFTLLTIFSAALPLTAFGIARPDSTGTRRYVLDTVRVVAETPVEAIGMVSRVIMAESNPGSISLRDGLQHIPGITNTQGTKDESNLRIRGFRKNEVKVLIDGRPLNSGYFGNVDLNNLLLGDISQALIIKGPASSIYGSGSMGGVVNLLRSPPDNKHWLSLESTFKRNATHTFAIRGSHRFRDWSYRAQAARETSNGMVLSNSFQPTPFENGGVRDNNSKQLWNFDGGIDLYPNEFHRFGATAGVTLMDEKPIPTSVYELGHRLYKDWARYQSTLSWDGILSGTLGAGAMLYLDGGRDRYLEFNDAAQQSLSLDSYMRYFSLGFSTRFEVRAWDKGVLHLGTKVENSFSKRRDNGFYPDWTSHRLGTYNLFAHYTYPLSDYLTISPGIGISASENDLKASVHVFAEPSLGLNFRHPSGSQSNFAVGSSTSFPTMRQLFSTERGNPDLLPQSALKLELSHWRPFSSLPLAPSAEISLFYNDVRDLIDVYNGRYENIYRVQSYGSEIGIGLSPLPYWHSEISFACLAYSASSDFRLTESPRNSLVISQRLALPFDVTALLSSHWSDIRHSQDALNSYRVLDSYWKHDLSLRRSFRSLDVSLGLENILDANYFTEYGYPAAGVNFFLKLAINI